ncbi:hypothetical protein [Methylobacterium thuringiense]|uniref:Uncharacterized protein n=1 Tax=Methylobacterium thuringiense TaxID=1003091 RepID=A0ABQ4TQT3_9HYPH|nr:hypothetical protein [Methylobacterium thuringiense]GJE57356.1 hypothetical protein EKPJFOCH_3870 [Methylobacterium thuringiense]
MTPDDKPEPPKAGEADTDQAKRTIKNQAPDSPPDKDKPDEGKRPDQLTSENDGGGEG